MAKVFFLLFVPGPALIGFSTGWLTRHPHDWSGPAVVGPVGLLLTVLTYRWGLRRLPALSAEHKPFFMVGMVAGAMSGAVIFAMLAVGLIG